MLRGEYIADFNPPEVLIAGERRQVNLLYDGLSAMYAASRSAEAGGQPFICTPAEAEDARTNWNLGLHQTDPDVRRVTPRTAELAYRGLVRIHAHLEEAGAAEHGTGAGNEPFAKRKRQVGVALGDLAGLHTKLTEAGHFPALTQPAE